MLRILNQAKHPEIVALTDLKAHGGPESSSLESKLKVDFCFLSYVSPDLRVAGGTTHFVENLLRWSASDHVIRVWTTADASSLIRTVGGECMIRSVGSGTSALARSSVGVSALLILRVLQSLFAIGRIPSGAEAELIVAESHFIPDVIAAIALHKKYPRTKIVAYLHHLVPTPAARRYHSLIPSILAWFGQYASLRLMKRWRFHILTFSSVKKDLLRLGFLNQRLHTIQNGVNVKYISGARVSSLKFDGCFLGNALARKGIFDLPKIWALVCRELPDARLAIIGTGTAAQIDRLQREFESRGIGGNVSFLGYLSEEEKIATLKASKTFVFPSYEEGWGIAIAEALASGLPVIAYDLPAYTDIFRMGLVKVPIGSVESFAKNTLSILKHEDMRIGLQQMAYRQAAQYDLDNIAREEGKLLREISGTRLILIDPNLPSPSFRSVADT